MIGNMLFREHPVFPTHDRLGGDQEALQGRDGSIPMDHAVRLNR